MGQPTNFLGRLHAHLTEMDPGHGYEAHRDRYDVAIIVFSGKLDTGGEVIGPGSVLYYAAGVLHGLRNVGEEIARYLVIEFEHPETTADRKRKREARAAAQQIAGSAA
jgi:quercetin dioxygenase-like cupin family protein